MPPAETGFRIIRQTVIQTRKIGETADTIHKQSFLKTPTYAHVPFFDIFKAWSLWIDSSGPGKRNREICTSRTYRRLATRKS